MEFMKTPCGRAGERLSARLLRTAEEACGPFADSRSSREECRPIDEVLIRMEAILGSSPSWPWRPSPCPRRGGASVILPGLCHPAFERHREAIRSGGCPSSGRCGRR